MRICLKGIFTSKIGSDESENSSSMNQVKKRKDEICIKNVKFLRLLSEIDCEYIFKAFYVTKSLLHHVHGPHGKRS